MDIYVTTEKGALSNCYDIINTLSTNLIYREIELGRIDTSKLLDSSSEIVRGTPDYAAAVYLLTNCRLSNIRDIDSTIRSAALWYMANKEDQ